MKGEGLKEFKEQLFARLDALPLDAELPEDLITDPRILYVHDDAAPDHGLPTIAGTPREEVRGLRVEFGRAPVRRGPQVRRATLAKIYVRDPRRHLPQHGGIPTEVTGDPFNDMPFEMRSVLQGLSKYRSLMLADIPPAAPRALVIQQLFGMNLHEKATRQEADALVAAYAIDDLRGFYVCYIFPADESLAHFRFFYYCGCVVVPPDPVVT